MTEILSSGFDLFADFLKAIADGLSQLFAAWTDLGSSAADVPVEPVEPVEPETPAE